LVYKEPIHLEVIMRRGRIFFILAFVLILGLVGAFVVWQLLMRRAPAPSGTPTPQPVMVVYVTQNLSKGTTLEDEMLALIPWQQGQIPQGMVMGDQLTATTGRVVKYDLPAGIPLLENMLLSENEQIPTSGSPWALSIPPGMVAVSVPANCIANVSYALRPGDHVNVIASMMFVDVDTDFQSTLPNFTGVAISAGPPDPETQSQLPLTVGVTSLSQGGVIDPETGKPAPPSSLSPGIYGKVVIDPVLGQAVYVVPSEAQRPRYVSHMLLQDVVVLQVGNFPLPGQEAQGTATPTPQPGQEGEEQAAPVPPDVVTLIVRPQDAVTLNYVMTAQTKLAASLSLVLRAAGDSSRENVLPVTLEFLLEQYQIPVPARLPYSLNPRIDNVTLP
jgi:pilus assembly protein CpaB